MSYAIRHYRVGQGTACGLPYPYEVVLRPGCYSGPDAPRVSRHRTLRAAVRQARRSDRWLICVDGETYVFPASTAREIAAALRAVAARAHATDTGGAE